MARIQPQDDEDGDANGLDDFRPLTAEEAQKLRLQQPLLSIWRVVLAQVVVGLTVAVFTYNLDLCGTKGICNLVVNKHGQNTATR